jgi:hypothetical protein
MDDRSEDMDCYDDLLNDDESTPSESGGSWKRWKPDERTSINQLFRYYNEMAVYVNQRWTSGPDNTPPPKKPEGNIMNLLKTGKASKASFKEEMTDQELHDYLETKLQISAESLQSTFDPTTLTEIAEYLKIAYFKIQHTEGKNLNAHLDLGKYLKIAKDKFDAEKRRKRIKTTWKKWIEENTHIKEACARRHRELVSLTTEYQRLEKLSISYSDFIKMKNKIRDVFATNEEIARKWK